MKEAINKPVQRYLLMEYKSDFILDLTMLEGYELVLDHVQDKQEERLYQYWTSLQANPYVTVPPYHEFKAEIFGEKEKINKKNRVGNREVGTIRGDDLSKITTDDNRVIRI